MKKTFLSVGFVLAMSGTLHAQDCATGYCPASITVHHKAGSVSAVTQDVTYGVDKNSYSGTVACWITRNLGATMQATSATDATLASAGWYWQFNLKQGYSYSTGSRVPNTIWKTSISENSAWVAANDPCTLLLGATWRLPTSTEWSTTATTIGSYTASVLYASSLKIHASGLLNSVTGVNYNTGSIGYYWGSTNSSLTQGTDLYTATSAGGSETTEDKTLGFGIRCLRAY